MKVTKGSVKEQKRRSVNEKENERNEENNKKKEETKR
jgi:hypothetical protein